MDLDGAPLDQDGLECLDSQPVQSGGPVQENQPVLDNILEDIPDLRLDTLHHSLGTLDVVRQTPLYQAAHDEGLEELQGHPLRQAALVQLQFRPHDNHRPPAVVHPLAQKVLAETSLLTLEHVRE